MKKRLLPVAVGLSLVLCLASVVLWIFSARQAQSLTIVTRQKTFYEFYATKGLGVICTHDWPEPAGVRHLTFKKYDEFPLVLYSRFGGAFTRGWYHLDFGVSSGKAVVAVDSDGVVLRGITSFPDNDINKQNLSAPLPYWKLDLPYAAPVIATAILPLWVSASTILREVRKRIRTRHGCCPGCGYDLRAPRGRCPECGAVGEPTAA